MTCRWWGPSDRGSMLVEVTVLLVLVMMPLLYLVGTLGRVQAGAYAASAMARESTRAYVTAPQVAQAPGRAQAAGQLVLQSHGFTAAEGSVTLSCPQGACLTPDSTVVGEAVVQVDIPLIPDFMDGVLPTTVQMNASHTQEVDAFRQGL